MTKQYMVDVTLRAAFSVEAESEAEARRIVVGAVDDCASIHVSTEKGDTLDGEASIAADTSVHVEEEDLPDPAMNTYNVFCSRYVEQVCCVQVEAMSPDDAYKRGRAEASDADWKDGDGMLELGVTLVERTEP